MVTIHTSYKDSRFARLSFGDSGGDSMPVWGGISNIISAGIGAGASHYAARKYLQGVRETNETNLALAREQQAWDLEQWKRENEYNSAAAQLERWQQAGFSPQSFLGNTDVGNAASLQSPSLANQVAPGDLSGYASSFAQSIQSGIKGALDWKQLDLNQKQLNLEKERLANQTRETTSVVALNDALTKQAQKNLDFLDQQSKLTEEQRYKVRAEMELAVQRWEQLQKMFPLEYESKEVHLSMSKLDKILSEKTLQEKIKSYALQNGKTAAETENLLKQAIYWLYQGKEGEFNVSTQPLRFDILNWNQQQLKFNLDFDRNTKYTSLYFNRVMQGIHAFSELGHLAVDALDLIGNPKHTHVYNFFPDMPLNGR